MRRPAATNNRSCRHPWPESLGETDMKIALLILLGLMLGALGGAKVVGFQNEALQLSLQKLMRQIDVIDAPLDDVGSHMNL